MIKYRRVLLKLSGEGLAGEKKYWDVNKPQTKENMKAFGLDGEFITKICAVVKRCVDAGVQVAIVVGAGNFWRGVRDGGGVVERVRADHMGMLATAMNALALADGLEKQGAKTAVMTPITMSAIAEPYSRAKAISHLNNGRVVVLGCGTGSPFFSTDTGVTLRGAELGAEVLLLAKNGVDGIYSDDPNKCSDAVLFDSLNYEEMIMRDIKAMDTSATIMAREAGMKLIAFGLDDPENIWRVLNGEEVGTIVTEDGEVKIHKGE